MAHRWRRGDEPKRQSIDLGASALGEAARLDFRRGEAKDDWTNPEWYALASKLPKYRARLCQQQDPTSVKGIGNAMETLVGAAYACFTNYRHLRPGESLTWGCVSPEVGRQAWAPLWKLFAHLGIRATVPGGEQREPEFTYFCYLFLLARRATL